jgi:hypothetical protein
MAHSIRQCIALTTKLKLHELQDCTLHTVAAVTPYVMSLFILLLCCVHIIIIITQVHPDVSDAEDAHDVFIELSMIYNVLR